MHQEENFDNLSQSQHEAFATRMLVNWLETKRESVLTGQLDGDSLCGKYAGAVDGVVFCYFDSRRNSIKLRKPTSLMTVNDLLDYIEEEVLTCIEKDRPELLSKNWQGHWEFNDEEGLSFEEDEEDEEDEGFCAGGI